MKLNSLVFISVLVLVAIVLLIFSYIFFSKKRLLGDAKSVSQRILSLWSVFGGVFVILGVLAFFGSIAYILYVNFLLESDTGSMLIYNTIGFAFFVLSFLLMICGAVFIGVGHIKLLGVRMDFASAEAQHIDEDTKKDLFHSPELKNGAGL